MSNAQYLCPILTKSGVSWHIFIKDANVKFYTNTSSRSQRYIGKDRQTDRDDKGNKHFLQPICLKTQQNIICGNLDTSLGQNDK